MENQKHLPPAPKGMIYTDGKGNYGYDVTLAVGSKEDEFFLVPIEEYYKFREQQEAMI
jgi:hypothetical protein